MLAEAASCGDRMLCACYKLVALGSAAGSGFVDFERLRSKSKAIDYAASKAPPSPDHYVASGLSLVSFRTLAVSAFLARLSGRLQHCL